MANVDGAFGLRPVRQLGSMPFNNAPNEYRIATGATGPIYQGSLVIMATSGSVIIGTATAVDTVGVFNGCFYTDPTTKKPTWKNYYPGSVSTTDIVAFIYDDPDMTFEIQCAGTLAITDIGGNADTAGVSGSTINGQSSTELAASAGSGTAQMRIVGLSKDPDNSDVDSANANWYVFFNEHAYKTTTGT